MATDLPRLPRAEPFRVEDYLSPDTRIDMAVAELKALAAEEPVPAERRDDTPIFQAPHAMVFQAPAHRPAPSMDRSAGYVSRGIATAALVGIFSVITVGQTKDGTTMIRDAICALPLTSCTLR